MAVHVTVNDPYDELGMSLPIYEGDDEIMHTQIVPGVYPAEASHRDPVSGEEYADESGWVTVWDESSHYPSMGIAPGSSGSLFLGQGCGIMGCEAPAGAPHNHTVALLTGEWWGGQPTTARTVSIGYEVFDPWGKIAKITNKITHTGHAGVTIVVLEIKSGSDTWTVLMRPDEEITPDSIT